MNAMELLYLDDCAELGELMHDLAYEGNTATAVLLSDDALTLAQWLMAYDDVVVDSIEYDSAENWEFYVTLDSKMNLTVEYAFDNENKPKTKYNTDVMFLIDNATMLIARANECIMYEIRFDEESVCGDCCADCAMCERKQEEDAIYMALDFLDYLLGEQ